MGSSKNPGMFWNGSDVLCRLMHPYTFIFIFIYLIWSISSSLFVRAACKPNACSYTSSIQCRREFAHLSIISPCIQMPFKMSSWNSAWEFQRWGMQALSIFGCHFESRCQTKMWIHLNFGIDSATSGDIIITKLGTRVSKLGQQKPSLFGDWMLFWIKMADQNILFCDFFISPSQYIIA